MRIWFSTANRGNPCQLPKQGKTHKPFLLHLERLEDRLAPAAFNPNNLLVSFDSTLREYTPNGTMVQSFIIPNAGGDSPRGRDVTVDPNGNAYVYNGTFDPFLSRLDPVTNTWTHTTHVGWDTASNTSFGGLSSFGDFLFATDMNTSGGPQSQENGIIRFDTTTGTSQRFANGKNYVDLTVGLDGLVYGINVLDEVDVYDPTTLSQVQTFSFPNTTDYRSIAVNTNGEMFLAEWTGLIDHYDAAGMLQNSVNPPAIGNQFREIDIAPTGTIVFTYGASFVAVTDESLNNFQTFTVPGTFSSFVTFATYFPKNQPNGGIQGVVYEDSNTNGQRDTGEPPLSGITVYLDSNDNGILDTGEPSTTTNAAGQYSFTGLAPLTYQVRQIVPMGRMQSEPANGAAHTVTVMVSQTVSDVNFGNEALPPPPTELGNRVWHDLNGDGVQNADEPGLPGVVVELKNPVDGIIGNGNDLSFGITVTDDQGLYQFRGFFPDQEYYLAFRAPVGNAGQGFAFTSPNVVVADDTRDSDAHQTTGQTHVFFFDRLVDNTFDAGLIGNDPGFGFALGLGDSGLDKGKKVVTDGAGNVIVAGEYFDTVDFDKGSGTTELTSNGDRYIFLAQYSTHGALMWALGWGGSEEDQINDLVQDDQGNLYLLGEFSNTVDFDPGPGFSELSAGPGGEGFLLKLDSQGQFLWVHQWAEGAGNIVPTSLALDNAGNPFVLGNFWGMADLDPSGGTTDLISSGLGDVFVSRFDPDGNFMWAMQMGGTGDDSGNDIHVDGSGNIYSTGSFQGSADFDPAASVAPLTSNGLEDVFLSKLDSDGNFIWANSVGGTNQDIGKELVADAAGDLYVGGTFQDQLDFDPGVSVHNRTSNGRQDVFLLKLTPDADFQWVRTIGGFLEDQIGGMSLGQDGEVYVTGSFRVNAKFGNGTPEVSLTSKGSSDVFVARFNSDGRVPWAQQMGGALFDQAYSIAGDNLGALFVTGQHQGSGDFAPGSAVSTLPPANNLDGFLAKFLANP